MCCTAPELRSSSPPLAPAAVGRKWGSRLTMLIMFVGGVLLTSGTVVPGYCSMVLGQRGIAPVLQPAAQPDHTHFSSCSYELCMGMGHGGGRSGGAIELCPPHLARSVLLPPGRSLRAHRLWLPGLLPHSPLLLR